MLSFINVIFIRSEYGKEVILGREAEQYLFREFSDCDYAAVETAAEAEALAEGDGVNLILPTDMPLVTMAAVSGVIESMRRRKISSMSLGSKQTPARVLIGKGKEEGYFISGTAFLRLGSAKNYGMVYNLLKERVIESHLRRGVIIPDTASVFIDDTAVIGAGAKILPFTKIAGSTAVAAGATIEASSVTDCVIDEQAIVQYSHLTSSRVRARASVGPFARLRGADVGEDCRIGDFVEVKASVLGKGVKSAHLSYIGDARVGEDTNVGCGTVFCNFDGKDKHKTEVGKHCFIGANTNLIAPLKVGDGAFIAAGTTVNKDVEGGSFTIGRVRQETKNKGREKPDKG